MLVSPKITPTNIFIIRTISANSCLKSIYNELVIFIKFGI